MASGTLTAPADHPLVSIVVCVYNAGEYLRPSIESVLHQTYLNFEVLVINDGSTDGCISSIRDISDQRLRIIDVPHGGRPRALNTALGELRGKYYATHDADDISWPNRIAEQVTFLESHPAVSAVFCGNDVILDGKSVAPRFRGKDVEECRRDILHYRMPAHDTTAMYRVSSVATMRYDEDLPYVEAYDYILRAGESLGMAVIGECLYSYRVHSASITRRDPRARIKYLAELLRRASARRGIEQSFPELDDFLTGRRPLRHQEYDNNLAAYFITSAQDLREAGAFRKAVLTGIHCILLHPMDRHYWKALVYAVLPMRLVHWLQRKS